MNFLASDFIHDYELPWIRERYKAGNLAILPLLVAPTTTRGVEELRWITDLQMLPGGVVPLSKYLNDAPSWEEVRVNILDAIFNRIEERRQQ